MGLQNERVRYARLPSFIVLGLVFDHVCHGFWCKYNHNTILLVPIHELEFSNFVFQLVLLPFGVSLTLTTLVLAVYASDIVAAFKQMKQLMEKLDRPKNAQNNNIDKFETVFLDS